MVFLPTHPKNAEQAIALTRSLGDFSTTDTRSRESSVVCFTNNQPIIQNVVSTFSVGCRLNLKHISESSRNAEYNPKRFSAVIMRIREPRTTALIFTTGKLVVTGAKSEELSKLACRKFARILQKLGYVVAFSGFTIQNIVASCDVGFQVRLERLAVGHGRYACYEPELFPGLVYRMIAPRVVLLVFMSGKMVITGAKVREDVYQAFDKIFPVVSLFKKVPYVPSTRKGEDEQRPGLENSGGGSKPRRRC